MRLQLIVMVIVLGVSPAWPAGQSGASESETVRKQAQPSSEQFSQRTDQAGAPRSNADPLHHAGQHGYPSDQYVIGIGQGDLAKGPIVCQRVSELSARTDLAKQIRIFVKEHMVDRVRERSGKEADQDIELTREEIVQEYLQGVKIVDHHVDLENNVCWATAVMPKTHLQPATSSNPLPPPPPITR